MSDLVERTAAIDAIRQAVGGAIWVSRVDCTKLLEELPPAQPEPATVTIGKTRGGVTMWYECDACGESVDENDKYCRECGRRLIHG